MRKISWLDHFVNLIVVITGISVAFALNNWNEEKKTNELHDTYIQAMIDDLDFDIAELDSLVKYESESLKIFRRLLSRSEPPLSDDSLNIAFARIASLNSFTSKNITYESIKSSGKFELLDLKLRIDIIEFYHSGYDQIDEIESYYRMNFDNQIIPILLNDAYGTGTGLNTDVIKSDKFRTVLGLHSSFLAQKIQAYQRGHNLALKLERELKANLK
ncbi:DUF6090 family protein [Fulvivirga lutea]|uniref:Uncharacterized protein n=1 Tax=Fulvivirga lutea TaxID=2810512 RepID=A0A974WDW1_9BACT|nr:DUF6090 family protein [Fulvivirga lutea]QSE96404.1 hypothetical protein JR347_12385 [Fulvivirga lutea]